MEPSVSIVVPTFNRCASLRRLREALADQTYPAAEFEVIVVDDGSTDATMDLLASSAAPYRLRIVEQSHGGPALARNRGVQEARGDLVVFLDDDVVPLPGLIAQHLATHQTTADAVVIGPMSAPPESWPRPAWVRWEEAKLQAQYDALVRGDWPCTPRQFYTGNASLSRARFREAGGFNVGFRRAEDVELGYRLRERGARFLFNPRAEVLHYASRSYESWCRTCYQYGQNDVVMEEPTEYASVEFHGRHPATRAMARLCVGRTPLVASIARLVRGLLAMTEPVGFRRPGGYALSALANLLYWQGMCDELGGTRNFWRKIQAGRGRQARSAAIPRGPKAADPLPLT